MLSDDKISHLTHVLLRELMDKDHIDITEDESEVRKAIKRAVNAQLQVGQEIEDAVRAKIESIQRNIAEGSPEWETLYQKFTEEEERRRGIVS